MARRNRRSERIVGAIARPAFFSVLALACAIATGCASGSDRRAGDVAEPSAGGEPFGGRAEELAREERVDMDGLKRSLGLDGPALGYRERSFNTCEAGYGFSQSHGCAAKRMVVVRFQIDCRESEGTETSTDYDSSPLRATDLSWTLAGQKGRARTDGSGQAELAMIASASARSQRLRVTRENDFLLVTAGEAKRIVAPRSWCGR